MATKQSSWQKTNLSQPKVKIVVITTLVATKPCRCDKKAWYKGQKLVVIFHFHFLLASTDLLIGELDLEEMFGVDR